MPYPLTTLYPQASGLYPGDGTEIVPTVTTGAATSVTNTSATVSGIVDPNELQTHYWFEYGLSPHIYGLGLPVEPYDEQTLETNMGVGVPDDPGFDYYPSSTLYPGTFYPYSGAATEVSATLTNLATGRTYYYRLVAFNGAGFSWGEEMSFGSEVSDLSEFLLDLVTEAGRGQ